jgi:hypothetical protein
MKQDEQVAAGTRLLRWVLVTVLSVSLFTALYLVVQKLE